VKEESPEHLDEVNLEQEYVPEKVEEEYQPMEEEYQPVEEQMPVKAADEQKDEVA